MGMTSDEPRRQAAKVSGIDLIKSGKKLAKYYKLTFSRSFAIAQ